MAEIFNMDTTKFLQESEASRTLIFVKSVK